MNARSDEWKECHRRRAAVFVGKGWAGGHPDAFWHGVRAGWSAWRQARPSTIGVLVGPAPPTATFWCVQGKQT